MQLSELSSQLPCKEELLLASAPALPCQQLHCPSELAQNKNQPKITDIFSVGLVSQRSLSRHWLTLW